MPFGSLAPEILPPAENPAAAPQWLRDFVYGTGRSPGTVKTNEPLAVAGNPAAVPPALRDFAYDAAKGAVQPVLDAGDYVGGVMSGTVPFKANEALQAAGGLAAGLVGPPGLRGAGSVLARAEQGAAKGIKAYHGSPHDFDRFDFSKIGTGEGAQAYGRGGYFAGAEPTAKAYRDALSQDLNIVRPTGERTSLMSLHPEVMQVLKEAGVVKRDHQYALANHAVNALFDAKSIPAVRKTYEHPVGWEGPWETALKSLEGYRVSPNKGHMYEVNLKTDPERMLDWDRPLREQQQILPNLSEAGITPKNIEPFDADRLAKLGDWGVEQNKFLESLGAKPGREVHNDLVSANARERLANPTMGGHAMQAAADRLRDAGIPGIKYQDQGSRVGGDAARVLEKYETRPKAIEAAEGRLAVADHRDDRNYWQNILKELRKPDSSNYVMFDDKMVDILRKYALPGMVGGGAAFGSLAPGQPQASGL